MTSDRGRARMAQELSDGGDGHAPFEGIRRVGVPPVISAQIRDADSILETPETAADAVAVPGPTFVIAKQGPALRLQPHEELGQLDHRPGKIHDPRPPGLAPGLVLVKHPHAGWVEVFRGYGGDFAGPAAGLAESKKEHLEVPTVYGSQDRPAFDQREDALPPQARGLFHEARGVVAQEAFADSPVEQSLDHTDGPILRRRIKVAAFQPRFHVLGGQSVNEKPTLTLAKSTEEMPVKGNGRRLPVLLQPAEEDLGQLNNSDDPPLMSEFAGIIGEEPMANLEGFSLVEFASGKQVLPAIQADVPSVAILTKPPASAFSLRTSSEHLGGVNCKVRLDPCSVTAGQGSLVFYRAIYRAIFDYDCPKSSGGEGI